MDFLQIRRLVILAVYSDGFLAEHLVLKGGNALEIGHGLLARSSLDVDFSIAGEFADAGEASARLFAALRDRFGPHGMIVFDERFSEIPPGPARNATPWWGGYRAAFKLLSQERESVLRRAPSAASRSALPVGPGQARIFCIDISKSEHCDGKMARDLDGFTVWVYSPVMLVVEKLRAICQQMPGYEALHNKRPRGRDFYDIKTIVTRLGVDLAASESRQVCHAVFAAKHVPLDLLSGLEDEQVREYHRADWGRVRATVRDGLDADYDTCFDFVCHEARKLQPLGME